MVPSLRAARSWTLLGLLAAGLPALWPARAAALAPERPIRALVRDTYRDRDGLPQNAVRALIQSAAGPLWIATDEGLARFDGATFTPLGRREEPGLTSNLATSLAETRDGTLWVGTFDGGLVRSRAGHLESFAVPGAPPGLRVTALCPDPAGGLWVGSSSGVFHLGDGSDRALTMAEGLPDDRVNAVAVDRDGAAWIGTRRGLSSVKAGRLVPGPEALRGVSVTVIEPDPTGGVWVGTVDRGLAHVGADGVRLLGMAQGLPSATVTALALDRHGSLWIGTQTAGLARLRDGRLERFGARDGLAGDWISTLFEDREGSIWVGTQDAGLVRLREADFSTLGVAEGLSHDSIEALLQTANRDLWLATDGGVDVLTGGKPPARRLLSGPPMSLYQDRQGAVWIGTIGQGLWRWKDGAVQRFSEGLPASTWFRAIAEDADGTLWAATTEGLYRLRGGRLEPVDDGLPTERPGVVAMVVTPKGGLFVSTDGSGVFRRGGGRFQHEDNGPPDSWVVSGFQVDDDGTLWLTTEGGGLWRRRAGAYAHLTMAQGLHADTLWTTLDDGRGHLWITSNRGIFRVDRADLDGVLDGRAPRLHSVRDWGMDDGLRSMESAGLSHPGGWIAEDGRLWFATLRGAAVVDPSRLRPDPPPPEVTILRASVAGEPRAVGAVVALAPGSGRLELEYTSRLLLGQGRASFRYRLVGLEADWTEPTRSRIAQYTNLPGGAHRFEVQARLGEGAWGPTATLDVTQAEAAWRSRWGLAAAGLALLALGASLLALASRLGAGGRRRVESDLRAARAEVEALSSLVPRCAWCKDERRDPAYLAQVDALMAARPTRQFDAALCPTCAARQRPASAPGATPPPHEK
jgi:ligand-binding sensor domain-containing protein